MKRLLVANRGEIAVRIIRTAHEMGIETVLAVSEADRTSYAARMSDHISVIGPAQASRSYLDGAAVLAAAVSSGADALHPGYGFLSEDAAFAQNVLDAGITWVGPSPESIALMGNKAAARRAAKDAGVPVLAGSDGVVELDDSLDGVAAGVGFPLLIKASAGGGGRGIRKVERPEDLHGELQLAMAEAGAAFGDSSVYLERFITRARHVEVQILGDGDSVVHLFDRDCSLQRRQQKIVEETPAPNLPDHLRSQMHTAAVHLAERTGYRGAGTVEFLYDAARQEICFIEMNTRLQVEHPVTEMVTGFDLVREQLRIASGEKLGFSQNDIHLNGHSIEMRINAENPGQGFMPSPGAITGLQWPGGPGVRVDSGIDQESAVSPYYDSLVAKVVVWNVDRTSALARARRALSEVRLEGIDSTTSYLMSVLGHPDVRDAVHHTMFLESESDELLQGTS